MSELLQIAEPASALYLGRFVPMMIRPRADRPVASAARAALR